MIALLEVQRPQSRALRKLGGGSLIFCRYCGLRKEWTGNKGGGTKECRGDKAIHKPSYIVLPRMHGAQVAEGTSSVPYSFTDSTTTDLSSITAHMLACLDLALPQRLKVGFEIRQSQS